MTLCKSSTASNAPNDVSATLTCGYMRNYVGQREQYVGNCGTQNEIHSAEVFNMFLLMNSGTNST